MNVEKKLLNKDFLFFVAGWELSMTADAMLRFALPLYILLQTGNVALMGTLLTLTSLPIILLTPIGGVLADRSNKRTLMVVLNLAIATFTTVYLIIRQLTDMVLITGLMLLVLLTLEALLTPSAEAAVPLLVPNDDLAKANGITFLLTIFSSVGAPIIAGRMLEGGDLSHIVVLSIVLFFLASVVKTFVNIPYRRVKIKEKMLKIITHDLKQGICFFTKEKPQMGKIILNITLASFVVAPLMSVAVSALVIDYFARGESMVGIAQGLVVFGGTFGVIFIGILGKKATIKLIRPILFTITLLFLITGFVFVTTVSRNIIFILMLASFFLKLSFMTVLAVISWSHLQEFTPSEHTGKVMALNGSFIAMGVALGNSLYGLLFDKFNSTPAYAFFILAGICLVISMILGLKDNHAKIPSHETK